jgi:hypothetical protein
VGLEIPAEVQSLSWIVEPDWPEGDETAMRRCAEAWRQGADNIKELIPDLRREAANVLDSVEGAAAEEFERYWQTFVTTDPRHLPELAKRCERLAERIESGALDIEYAKYLFIALLITTATEIAVLKATMLAALGTSAAGIPAVEAAAQVTSRAIGHKLLTTMAGRADDAGRDAAGQAVQVVGGGARAGVDPARPTTSATSVTAEASDGSGAANEGGRDTGEATLDSARAGAGTSAAVDGGASSSPGGPVPVVAAARADVPAVAGDPHGGDSAIGAPAADETPTRSHGGSSSAATGTGGPAADHAAATAGGGSPPRPSQPSEPFAPAAASAAGTSLAGAGPVDAPSIAATAAMAAPPAAMGQPAGDEAGGGDAPVAAGRSDDADDADDADDGKGGEGAGEPEAAPDGDTATRPADGGPAGGGMHGPYGMYGAGLGGGFGGGLSQPGGHSAGAPALPREAAEVPFIPSDAPPADAGSTQDSEPGAPTTEPPVDRPFSSAHGESPGGAAHDAPPAPYAPPAAAPTGFEQAEGLTEERPADPPADRAAAPGPAVFMVPPRLGGAGGSPRRTTGSRPARRSGSRPSPRSAAPAASAAPDDLGAAAPEPSAELRPSEAAPAGLPAHLRAAYDLSEATPAGRSLYGPDEPNMRELARRVRPDPDRYVLDGCGTPAGMRVGDRDLRVADIAAIVRDDPAWDGRELVLLSCGSVGGGAEFAADLARDLGVPVVASRGPVWSDRRGRVFFALAPDQPLTNGGQGPTWPPDRGWRTFHPDSVPAPPGPDAVVVARTDDGDGLTEPSMGTAAATNRVQR